MFFRWWCWHALETISQQINLKKIEEESQLIFGFQAIQSMCGFIPVSEGLSLVTAVRLCHLTSWHPCWQRVCWHLSSACKVLFGGQQSNNWSKRIFFEAIPGDSSVIVETHQVLLETTCYPASSGVLGYGNKNLACTVALGHRLLVKFISSSKGFLSVVAL